MCITLGLPEPIWKEKKAEKQQKAEEQEQLPGQMEMDLMEEQEPAEEPALWKAPMWIMPKDETQETLKRISDQLEQISKALWALVKGGGNK